MRTLINSKECFHNKNCLMFTKRCRNYWLNRKHSLDICMRWFFKIFSKCFVFQLLSLLLFIWHLMWGIPYNIHTHNGNWLYGRWKSNRNLQISWIFRHLHLRFLPTRYPNSIVILLRNTNTYIYAYMCLYILQIL